MCDVIKIRLKWRDATRSKIKYKLHLKFGNPSMKIGRSRAVLIFSGWFPFQLLVAILLFRRIFMTSHMTLSCASICSCLFFVKLSDEVNGIQFCSHKSDHIILGINFYNCKGATNLHDY